MCKNTRQVGFDFYPNSLIRILLHGLPDTQAAWGARGPDIRLSSEGANIHLDFRSILSSVLKLDCSGESIAVFIRNRYKAEPRSIEQVGLAVSST